MSKSLLCRIGIHKWTRSRFTYCEGSNVRDCEKRCLRCGKRKSWIEVFREG